MDTSPQWQQQQQQQQQRQAVLHASPSREPSVRRYDNGRPEQPSGRSGYTHAAEDYPSPIATAPHYSAAAGYEHANSGYSPSFRPLYHNNRQSMYGGDHINQVPRMTPARPALPGQSDPYSNRVSMIDVPAQFATTGAPRNGYVYRSNTMSPTSRPPAAMQSHTPFPRRAETMYTEHQQLQHYRQYEQQQGYYRESAPIRQVSISQHQTQPRPPPNTNNLPYYKAPYPTFPDGRPLVPAPLARPPPSGMTPPSANRPPSQPTPQRSATISQTNGSPTLNRYSTVGTARNSLPTAPTPPAQSAAQMESSRPESSTGEQGALDDTSSSDPVVTAAHSSPGTAGPSIASPASVPASTGETAPTSLASVPSPAIVPEEMGRSRSSGPTPSRPGGHHQQYPVYPPNAQAHHTGYTLYDAPVPHTYSRPVSKIMDIPSPLYSNGQTGAVHSLPASPYANVSRVLSTTGLSRTGTASMSNHWESTASRPMMPLSPSMHQHRLGPVIMNGVPPQRSTSAMIPASAKQQAHRPNVPIHPPVQQSYSRQITLSKIPSNEEVPPMPGRMTSKNGKVRIQLQFDRPFFNAGGELSGRLELQCSSSRSVMLADMVIELVGYEALSKDHLIPRIFHKTILRLQDAHHPSQAVQEHIDPDKDGFWTARKGRTIFPFRLNIQDSLPNSYESKLGQVRYVTSAIAYIKTSQKEVVHHTREVFIYETWTTDDITQARRKSVKADTSKRLFLGGEGSLEMYAELTRTMVSSGGIVYVNVGVKNQTKKKIMGIKLSLWRHVAASHKRVSMGSGATSLSSKDQDSVKNYSEIIYKGEDYNFDGDDPRIVVLPVYIPSGVYSLRNTRLLHVQFFVQVSLMASLSKALAVELPIYITHASSWSDPPPRVPKDFSFPVHEDEPSVKNKTGVFAKKKPALPPINTASPARSTGKRASISGPSTGVNSMSSSSTTSRIASASTPSLTSASTTLPYRRRAPVKDPDSPTSVLDLAQASNLFVVNPDDGRGGDEGAVANSPPLTAQRPTSSIPMKPKETLENLQEEQEMDESHFRPSEIIYDTPVAKEAERPAVASSISCTSGTSGMSGTSGTSMSSLEEDGVTPAHSGTDSPLLTEKSVKSKTSCPKLGLRKTLAKLSISIPAPANGSSTSLNNLSSSTGSSSRISPRVLPATTTVINGTNGNGSNHSRSSSSSKPMQPMRPYASSDDLLAHARDRSTSTSSSASSISREFGLTPIDRSSSEDSEIIISDRRVSHQSDSSEQQQHPPMSASPLSYTPKPLSRESSLSRHSSTSSMSSFMSASRMDRHCSRRSSAGSVRIMAISPGASALNTPTTPVVIEGVGVIEATPPVEPQQQAQHPRPALESFIPETDINKREPMSSRSSVRSRSVPGSAAGTRSNSPNVQQHHAQEITHSHMEQQLHEDVAHAHHLQHHYGVEHHDELLVHEEGTMAHAENVATADVEGCETNQQRYQQGQHTALLNGSAYQDMTSSPIYGLEQHAMVGLEASGNTFDSGYYHPPSSVGVGTTPDMMVDAMYAPPGHLQHQHQHEHEYEHEYEHEHGHQQHHTQDEATHETGHMAEGYVQKQMSRTATPTQTRSPYVLTEEVPFELASPASVSGHTTPTNHPSGPQSHSPDMVPSGLRSASPRRQSPVHATRPIRDMMIAPAAYPDNVGDGHGLGGRHSPIRASGTPTAASGASSATLRHYGSASSLRSTGSASSAYSSSSRPQSPFPAMRVNQLRQEHHEAMLGLAGHGAEGGSASSSSSSSGLESPESCDTFLRASHSSESLPYRTASPALENHTPSSMGAVPAVEPSPLATARVLTGVYSDYYDELAQRAEDPQDLFEKQRHHRHTSEEHHPTKQHLSTHPKSGLGGTLCHLVSVLPLMPRQACSASKRGPKRPSSRSGAYEDARFQDARMAQQQQPYVTVEAATATTLTDDSSSLPDSTGPLRVVNDVAVSLSEVDEEHHQHHYLMEPHGAIAGSREAYTGMSEESYLTVAKSPRYASSFHSVLSDEETMPSAGRTPVAIDQVNDEGQDALGYSTDMTYDAGGYYGEHEQQYQAMYDENPSTIGEASLTIPMVTVDKQPLTADASKTPTAIATSGGHMDLSPSVMPALFASPATPAEEPVEATVGYPQEMLQQQAQHGTDPVSNVATYEAHGPGLGLDGYSSPKEYSQESSYQPPPQHQPQQQWSHTSHETPPLPPAAVSVETLSRSPLIVVPPRSKSYDEGSAPFAAVAAAVAAAATSTPSALNAGTDSSVSPGTGGETGTGVQASATSEPYLQPQQYQAHAQYHHQQQPHQYQSQQQQQYYDRPVELTQVPSPQPPKIPARPPGYLPPTRGQSIDKADLANLPPLPLSPAHVLPPSPGQQHEQHQQHQQYQQRMYVSRGNSSQSLDLASLPPLPLSPANLPPSPRPQQQQQQQRMYFSRANSGGSGGHLLDLTNLPPLPLSPAHTLSPAHSLSPAYQLSPPGTPGQQHHQQQQQHYFQQHRSQLSPGQLHLQQRSLHSSPDLGDPSPRTSLSPAAAAGSGRTEQVDSEPHDVVIEVGPQNGL